MKVLLIGKFPPGQGGIASKTYWLYRSLSARGFAFDIVSLVPDLYSSREDSILPPGFRVKLLRENHEAPWFIPGGGLETERLVSAALEFAENQRPDIIECNYLAPYGTASSIVSRLLGVPLIIRHAGSDLAKLLSWDQTRSALEYLLAQADLVVSNVDAIDQLKYLTDRIISLPRYVPDPKFFNSSSQDPQEKLILYVGKLNYYWQLKALDSLLSALQLQNSWKLLAIAGGTGRQAFEDAIRDNRLEDRVNIMEFLPPDRMPEIIKTARLIWAVERRGNIPEFSNVVWESISCGRCCLVFPDTFKHPDATMLAGSPLLKSVDPEDSTSIASSFDQCNTAYNYDGLDLSEAHRQYVFNNASIYEAVLQGTVPVYKEPTRDDL